MSNKTSKCPMCGFCTLQAVFKSSFMVNLNFWAVKFQNLFHEDSMWFPKNMMPKYVHQIFGKFFVLLKNQIVILSSCFCSI